MHKKIGDKNRIDSLRERLMRVLDALLVCVLQRYAAEF